MTTSSLATKEQLKAAKMLKEEMDLKEDKVLEATRSKV